VSIIRQSDLSNPVYANWLGPDTFDTQILNITHEGYKRLEIVDCVNAYAKTIQSTWGDLILVTTDDSTPNPQYDSKHKGNVTLWPATHVPAFSDQGNPQAWMCSEDSSDDSKCLDIEKLRANAAKGFIGIYPVQYCLSKKMALNYKIQWNTRIAIIITALNFIKAVVLLYTALGIKEKPLMSIGDAIRSFLKTTDQTTLNMCLASNIDCKKTKNNFYAGPRRWKSKKYHWKYAPSKTRWASFGIL